MLIANTIGICFLGWQRKTRPLKIIEVLWLSLQDVEFIIVTRKVSVSLVHQMRTFFFFFFFFFLNEGGGQVSG